MENCNCLSKFVVGFFCKHLLSRTSTRLKKGLFGLCQVFLTLCTLVTLYFAEEVPLMAYQPHHLSDSAPLLDNPQQIGFDNSKSKLDMSAVDNATGNNPESSYEINKNAKNLTPIVQEQNESFSDGPGAVLVNLLTSLRHLPPAMHSVLLVMALSWVSASVVTCHQFCFQYCMAISNLKLACLLIIDY